ncbi:MAG: phosphoglucosamine mutase [Tissierellia bacterium]|nr:phosphoglucosamine mutase [Tissierellia bacterium]
MTRLFGTDGIRGVTGTELTPELAFTVGKAAGQVLAPEEKGFVLVGKDTRLSGDMLESSLCSGLMAMGLDVVLLGIIPTPAVAYLTKKYGASAGVVISASHNPYEYNGIKFFSSTGYKLPDPVEEEMEKYIFGEKEFRKNGGHYGRYLTGYDGLKDYEEYLISLCPFSLRDKTIALDCGNGALSKLAPLVFTKLGANVVALNTDYNGTNINDNCGSTNPKVIQDLVLSRKADIGLSFDGDADRVIAVDEKGRIVDGDHILAICATYLKERGKLHGNTVVGTVMTNIGLDKYLESQGINIIKSAVGDRYVLEEMKKGKFVLGGEQSGHIIFTDFNTTGDGIATGLHLLEVMTAMKKPLSLLNDLMISYPQVLVNAKINSKWKQRYMEHLEIKEAIDLLNDTFHGEGRIVIRPSGTEPLVRVMIEGNDEEFLLQEATKLAQLMEEKLQ